MRNLWLILRFEFSRQIIRRGYAWITFGVPIIALAIFFLLRAISSIPAEADTAPSSDAEAPISSISENSLFAPMGFVDHSGLLGTVPTLIRFASSEAALEALHKGEISAYYVIAADYLQTGKIDVFFERFNLGSINHLPIQWALLNALLRRTELSPRLLALLQAQELSFVLKAISEGAAQVTEDTNFILAYVFAILLIFTVFITSGYLTQSLAEEKENRIVEVLLTSSRPRDLLFGKFLAMNALGLLQMIAWIGTAIFILTQLAGSLPDLSGLRLEFSRIAVLAIYFVLGYLFFGACNAIIGALARNFRESTQLSAVIILPAMIPFYLAVTFINTPNAPLPVVLSLIPITSPLAMTLRASITEVPLGELLLSMALLGSAIIALVWLAARLFRVSLLLSGQQPKLLDVLRLVRERV